MVPGESAAFRGFAHRAGVTLPGIGVLVLWYAFCVGVILFGVWVGRKLPNSKHLARFENEATLERWFYWFVSAMAVVGMVATVITVAQSVAIWDAVASSNANLLSQALPNHSSAASLRYATAVAAPVGVYLSQQRRAPVALAIMNVVLLLASATMSSRLSFLVAVLVYIFLVLKCNKNFRLRIWVAVLAIILLVGGLTAFNYVRNSNFYESHGVTNPIAMNFFQVAAYLDTPAQVSIGVSNSIADKRLVIPGGPVSSIVAVIPTFLIVDKGDRMETDTAARYGNVVSIANNFNANSSFADTYGMFGMWGLFYLLLALAFAAFIFGALVRYRSVVAVIPAILLYGFADFWRAFVFHTGILLFMILVAAAGIVFALVASRFIERRSKLAFAPQSPTRLRASRRP